MELKTLLEKVSKDVNYLIELKVLAVKVQDYDLAAECRRLENELFPITDHKIKINKHCIEIEAALNLVGVNINDKKVCYKIDKTLELFRKKGDGFNLKDASKIISDVDKIFKSNFSKRIKN